MTNTWFVLKFDIIHLELNVSQRPLILLSNNNVVFPSSEVEIPYVVHLLWKHSKPDPWIHAKALEIQIPQSGNIS